MRVKQHQLVRRFALSTTAAMMGMAVALVWGAGVSFASVIADGYYEGANNGDLCVGITFLGGFTKSCEWLYISGENNVGVGQEALNSITSGENNVAISYRALFANTEGRNDVGVGKEALLEDTTGTEDVAVGSNALASNNASDNDAYGVLAMAENRSGGNNVASGEEASELGEEGSNNVAIGGRALFRNNASGNVGIGASALEESRKGEDNSALGLNAGQFVEGSDNIDLANEGGSESGTTRIGTDGLQTRAFMAGIFPTHVTGCFVQVTSSGQLGCNPEAAAEGKEREEGDDERASARQAGKGGKASAKGLKICVQEMAGGAIKLPPCKKGYNEKEVAEL